jgi:hypothetical protein
MRQLILFGFPAVVLALGVPLWLQMVPPNRFYGYRTATTLASERVWYQVNQWTGLALIVAGVLGFAIAGCAQYTFPSWRRETKILISVLADSAIIIGALLNVVIRTNKV